MYMAVAQSFFLRMVVLAMLMVIFTSNVDGNMHRQCFDELEVSSFLLMLTHVSHSLSHMTRGQETWKDTEIQASDMGLVDPGNRTRGHIIYIYILKKLQTQKEI